MKKSLLNGYLGQEVKVWLHDGSEYGGILHKTGEDAFRHDANLYLPKGYYFVSAHGVVKGALFRSSHVRKLEVV